MSKAKSPPIDLPEDFLAACKKRWRARYEMTADAWIKDMGSGTLQRAKAAAPKNEDSQDGMTWRAMYLDERIAAEYGQGFEAIAPNRIMTGPAIASSNCSATTETLWLARCFNTNSIFGDIAKPAQIAVEYPDGNKAEGMGLRLQIKRRPSWLPKGYVVFAFVAKYDTVNRKYGPTVNPL